MLSEREEGDASPQIEQQAVARRIVEMRDEGQSFRRISDRLNTAGIRPQFGREWVPMTVKRIYDRTAQAA